MAVESANSSQAAAIQLDREFLTFTLGFEEYGVRIGSVQEIRGYDNVTRVPDAPEYVKGVINLRGAIVPVVDLRIRFALGNVEYNALTVMMIVNVGNRVVGVVVDSVSDVVVLKSAQIGPPPEFGTAFDTRYIEGLGTIDRRMLILIDMERLLSSREMAIFSQETAEAA